MSVHRGAAGAGRLWVVWCVTVGLTTTTWLESNDGHGGAVAVLVVLLTLVKAALVVLEYMEVRRAPAWLLAACATWGVAVGATLLVLVV